MKVMEQVGQYDPVPLSSLLLQGDSPLLQYDAESKVRCQLAMLHLRA